MSIIQFYFVFSILAVFGAIALGSQKIVLTSELDSDSIEPTELTELLYMKQFQDVNHTPAAKWDAGSFMKVVCVQGNVQ